jgi:pilus assembly protein FimV
LSTFALALLVLGVGGPLRAAELGEVKVNSHIGQQLSADIELVDLTSADLSEIQARLANPDVFKVAGLEVPPVLGGLNIAIARRDNKRFLHLTTLQPVNVGTLHIFLELSSGGKQAIRAASLWLTPEPPVATPATVTRPAAPPEAQQSAEAGLNEAAQRAFAYRKQKALEQAQGRAAGQSTPPATVAEPSPSAAAPAVATPQAVAVGSATGAPASAAAAPVAVSRLPAAARHVSVAPPVQPQSCAPEKQVAAQLQQCQAMTSKLSDIEGKVRRLQSAMIAPAGGAIAAAATPATPPSAAPKVEAAAGKPAALVTKPSPAPVKPGVTPVKPGVAADLAGNSRKRLIMIGGGVLAGLAALGGMIFFLRKRQAKGPLKIWQSFRKKGEAEVVEAVPEEAEQLAAQ